VSLYPCNPSPSILISTNQPESRVPIRSLPYKPTKKGHNKNDNKPKVNNFNTVRNEVDLNRKFYSTSIGEQSAARSVSKPSLYPIPTPVRHFCSVYSSPSQSQDISKVTSHLPRTTTTLCLFLRCPRRPGGGSPHRGKRKSLKKAWKKRSMFVTRLLSCYFSISFIFEM
jgi:hypothetical protein